MDTSVLYNRHSKQEYIIKWSEMVRKTLKIVEIAYHGPALYQIEGKFPSNYIIKHKVSRMPQDPYSF
jgi:hypothetical protein